MLNGPFKDSQRNRPRLMMMMWAMMKSAVLHLPTASGSCHGPYRPPAPLRATSSPSARSRKPPSKTPPTPQQPQPQATRSTASLPPPRSLPAPSSTPINCCCCQHHPRPQLHQKCHIGARLSGRTKRSLGASVMWRITITPPRAVSGGRCRWQSTPDSFHPGVKKPVLIGDCR